MPAALLRQTEQWRDVEIWPDQALTVDVFTAMLTQWRISPAGGVTGLDYAALPAVMDFMAVPAADRPEVFQGLRIMERAAVTALRAQK